MGFEYTISFYDAENKNIGGETLEKRYTHYDPLMRAFWDDICYSEMPKKLFVEQFLKKINELDINSESFIYLVKALGMIVESYGWSNAIIIHVGTS
jgi:hypothetical protein